VPSLSGGGINYKNREEVDTLPGNQNYQDVPSETGESPVHKKVGNPNQKKVGPLSCDWDGG